MIPEHKGDAVIQRAYAISALEDLQPDRNPVHLVSLTEPFYDAEAALRRFTHPDDALPEPYVFRPRSSDVKGFVERDGDLPASFSRVYEVQDEREEARKGLIQAHRDFNEAERRVTDARRAYEADCDELGRERVRREIEQAVTEGGVVDA